MDLRAYVLMDFLEMRTQLAPQEMERLTQLLKKHLEPGGELTPLPAFLAGEHAVLCIGKVFRMWNLRALKAKGQISSTPEFQPPLNNGLLRAPGPEA